MLTKNTRNIYGPKHLANETFVFIFVLRPETLLFIIYFVSFPALATANILLKFYKELKRDNTG